MIKRYKPTLHLMVGLPCSGKTTKAKELAERYHAIRFSPDEWMIELFGQYSGNEHDTRHDKIEKIQLKVAFEILKRGSSVVIDFGCWSKNCRNSVKKIAETADANFMIHFMNVSTKELFKRLEQRNANLPEGVFHIEKEWMEAWIPKFQQPTGKELAYTKTYFPSENIGECNIFMQCNKVNENAFSKIPKGYSIRLCHEDELETWAKIASPQYWQYVINYYNRAYKPQSKEFFKRCTFVVDENDTPVSTCFLWKSYDQITTIAWLATLPEYEGKGLGRALLTHLLKNVKPPIFLHTHPTLFHAISLYASFGFQFVKSEFVGYRSNDYDECLDFMKNGMGKWFPNARTTLPSKKLLLAALSNLEAEF